MIARIDHVSVVDVAAGAVLPAGSLTLRGSSPTGAVIDGTGLYDCPGLIDCHTHLFLDAGPGEPANRALREGVLATSGKDQATKVGAPPVLLRSVHSSGDTKRKTRIARKLGATPL